MRSLSPSRLVLLLFAVLALGTVARAAVDIKFELAVRDSRLEEFPVGSAAELILRVQKDEGCFSQIASQFFCRHELPIRFRKDGADYATGDLFDTSVTNVTAGFSVIADARRNDTPYTIAFSGSTEPGGALNEDDPRDISVFCVDGFFDRFDLQVVVSQQTTPETELVLNVTGVSMEQVDDGPGGGDDDPAGDAKDDAVAGTRLLLTDMAAVLQVLRAGLDIEDARSKRAKLLDKIDKVGEKIDKKLAQEKIAKALANFGKIHKLADKGELTAELVDELIGARDVLVTYTDDLIAVGDTIIAAIQAAGGTVPQGLLRKHQRAVEGIEDLRDAETSPKIYKEIIKLKIDAVLKKLEKRQRKL